MRIIRLFILTLFVSGYLEANYCIQVLTTNKSELSFMLNKAKSNNYDRFDMVRVERRGNYLVFRVGDYNRYNDAVADVSNIRKNQKGAYIRKCDFIREKALYVKDDKEDYVKPQPQRIEPRRVERQRQRIKPVVKKKYTQKKELRYTYKNSNDSLWGDCKKCFVPVYEEEDNVPYQEDVPVQRKKRVEKKELRVEVPEPQTRKESFWAEDTHVYEKKIKKVRRHRKRNKFNIDEQFLP